MRQSAVVILLMKELIFLQLAHCLAREILITLEEISFNLWNRYFRV